jgi:hypothetical protein
MEFMMLQKTGRDGVIFARNVLQITIKCLLTAGCQFLGSNKVVVQINEEYHA